MDSKCWADGYEIGSEECAEFHRRGGVHVNPDEEVQYVDPDEGTVILVQREDGPCVLMRIYKQSGWDGWVDQTGERYTCDTVIRYPGKLLVRARRAVVYEVVGE